MPRTKKSTPSSSLNFPTNDEFRFRALRGRDLERVDRDAKATAEFAELPPEERAAKIRELAGQRKLRFPRVNPGLGIGHFRACVVLPDVPFHGDANERDRYQKEVLDPFALRLERYRFHTREAVVRGNKKSIFAFLEFYYAGDDEAFNAAEQTLTYGKVLALPPL